MSDYIITSAAPGSGYGIVANTIVPTYVICITGTDGKMLAGIKPDGTIEYGPTYTPDQAARTFWEAMGKGWLGFLAPIVDQEIAKREAAKRA